MTGPNPYGPTPNIISYNNPKPQSACLNHRAGCRACPENHRARKRESRMGWRKHQHVRQPLQPSEVGQFSPKATSCLTCNPLVLYKQLTRWTDAMDKDGRVTWLLKKLRSNAIKPVSECASHLLICHLQHIHIHQSTPVIKMFPHFDIVMQGCASHHPTHTPRTAASSLYQATTTAKLFSCGRQEEAVMQ